MAAMKAYIDKTKLEVISHFEKVMALQATDPNALKGTTGFCSAIYSLTLA